MKERIISHLPQELLNVSSEIGMLKKVIVHRPDDGIEKVTPSRATFLLYEDIVFLDKMKEEHDIYTSALRALIGDQNVIDIQDLLRDILKNKDVKEGIIESICKLENCDKRIEEFLLDMEAEILAKTLITGMLNYKKKIPVFYPLPNLIFTRDIGTIINDHLLICQSSKKARSRESVICYFIFHHHELFRGFTLNNKTLELYDDQENMIHLNNGALGTLSMEGGDIMMLNNNHLLLGCSERTSESAIQNIINKIFAKKVVKKISVIYLPQNRYCMHLDTIMTQINTNEMVVYKPLILESNQAKVSHHFGNESIEYSSLGELLKKECPEIEFILCGKGVFPYDEREQWTDACNLFSVKPGVAFSYDRNIKTLESLSDKGYRIIKATELTESILKDKENSTSLQKTIITIPSNELSRARGGPHCLTMPICRL